VKIYMTFCEGEGWPRPLESIIWNPSPYIEKTFRHCDWEPDFIFEGMFVERYGERVLVIHTLKGAGHPRCIIAVTHLLRASRKFIEGGS